MVQANFVSTGAFLVKFNQFSVENKLWVTSSDKEARNWELKEL